MTPPEAAILLGVCAAYDRRTVGEVDALAWAEALHDVPLDDAKTAVVQHYRTTRDWIMPSDVRTLARQAREQRIARHPVPPPAAELADVPPAYAAQLQATVTRLADGADISNALPAGSGAPPNEEYNRARGAYRDPIRLAAKRFRCPWPPCQAAAGASCTTATGRPLTDRPAHDARLEILVMTGHAEWVEIDGVQQLVLRGEGAA